VQISTHYFAKSKIDVVIKLLNHNELDVNQLKEAETIINMIGEPVIKRYLQKELANKRLSKVDKIDFMVKQMLSLQNQINELQNTEGGGNDTN
jgi:chaperonin cofactor prefoldin